MNPTINRFLYAGFVLLAVVMFTTGNWMTGVSNLGIALIFDPFDAKQPFNKRPTWQKTWLVVHACALLTAAGIEVYSSI